MLKPFVRKLTELGQTPQQNWRGAFLVALPVPALALLLGLALEQLGAQASPYDTLMYPAFAGHAAPTRRTFTAPRHLVRAGFFGHDERGVTVFFK